MTKTARYNKEVSDKSERVIREFNNLLSDWFELGWKVEVLIAEVSRGDKIHKRQMVALTISNEGNYVNLTADSQHVQ